MRIVFVLTYPTYHAIADVDEWLRVENRDRWMPASLAAMGVDVELWGVARGAQETISALPGAAPYRIRLFAPSGGGAKTRNHYSDDLVAAARDPGIDMFVLIGVDGGIGLRLWREELAPRGRRYAVIIGGDYWSLLVPGGEIVFYESEVQRRALLGGGWRPWRRIDAARLHRLPKSIDTSRFAPMPEVVPSRDVVAISTLSFWKSFDEVGALSRDGIGVTVAGAGPREAELKRKYPGIEWVGRIPHAEIPALLASARLYVHAGRREYFPRAIVEAMACGIPVVAFDDRFGPDVVPPDCGLLVDDRGYRKKVTALLDDEPRRRRLGAAARAHAVAHYGRASTEPANRLLIERVAA